MVGTLWSPHTPGLATEAKMQGPCGVCREAGHTMWASVPLSTFSYSHASLTDGISHPKITQLLAFFRSPHFYELRFYLKHIQNQASKHNLRAGLMGPTGIGEADFKVRPRRRCRGAQNSRAIKITSSHTHRCEDLLEWP